MGIKKISVWIIILTFLALTAGFFIGTFVSGKSSTRKILFNSSNKIEVILDIINQEYVDTVNISDLTESAIPKIIGELDPHSDYVPARDLEEMKDNMEGHFTGVGVDFVIHLDTIVVISVTHGGPAEQAGILPGDRIVTVNDSSFVGNLTEEKVFSRFKGSLGSSVKIGLLRNHSEEIINYTIKVGSIPLTTIKAAYEVAPGIGLIKIYDKFSYTTYDEFLTAIAKLLNQGCESFIIDLRMNKGGAFDAALKICNEFLSQGQSIVYIEGKSYPREDFFANGLGTLQKNQLVVLVDQISASASEIVAGAIQDNDRGLIIGRKTFGKGLVQNQVELSDGSALRLTIARYFTPSGRNIQRAYEMGKLNEYNQEWLDQLFNGESFHEESVSIDTTQIYHTASGRPVYGGGGIMPDIFVPMDTTEMTSYYMNLENKGVFHQFAFDFTDANREKLNQFSNYQEMLEFLKTQPILYEIIRFAEEKGVRRRSSLIRISAERILYTTYANILLNFYGEEAYFIVSMMNDNMVKRAIEVIQNEEAFTSAVAQRKREIRKEVPTEPVAAIAEPVSIWEEN